MVSLFDLGPAEPCPSPFNLAARVLTAGLDCPDKAALEVLGDDTVERLSFAALRAAVLGAATGLLEAGLAPGDRVLLRLGNSKDFPIAYLAAIAVGVVPVPTSPMLTEGEVAKIIAELQPGAILRAPEVACPTHDNIIPLKTLRSFYTLPPADFTYGDPDRLAYVVYTSGTSGKPRAVAHAHRAIWARRMMLGGWYDLRPSDRLLHAGAFNWTFTLGTGLLDPWSIGATALIPAEGTPPEALPSLLKTHRATLFAAAPGVFRKCLKATPLPALPDLRHGLSAGEKLSPQIAEDWRAATGTAVYEAFGMSECSTFISASPAHPVVPETLGRPQAGRRIAILDENGPVPLNTPGVIAVDRSDPGLMLGYLNAHEETAQKYQGDWFLTGDLGTMDADFQIRYLGRADDMMNAGGYRVSPLEVEAALSGHPELSQIGVTDVAVKEGVRVIAAFYVAENDLDRDKLAAFAESRLAAYKRPRIFQRLDALPTNPNGKLSRARLRQLYEAMT